MTDIQEVLRWLAGAGSVAVVSWFASWLLESFAWWAALKSQFKSLIILVLALLLGLLATWVLSQPPETLAPLLPYLTTAVLAISAWLASQVAHRADSKAQ
jgi:hypothetical protein